MYQWLQRLLPGSARSSAPVSSEAPDAPPLRATPPAAPAPVVVGAAPAGASAFSAAAPAPGTAPPRAGVSFDQLDRVNGIYFNWLFGADPDAAVAFETTPMESQVLDAVSAIVGSQQSGAALVRRLPGLIPQLLQSLRSDNFSGAQLSRTISNDVVLVAAVIRMANSSFLGCGATITSVEHAVMLIGQEGLRHLITSVAFRPIIDLRSGHFTRMLAPRIWDQSERCAVASRTLAEALGIDPFEAFLAGLLQNVGLIVTLRMMDQVTQGAPQLGSEIFCAHLVRDARTLSCAIGREWNFPDSVTRAISEQAGMKKGSAISPLGRLLTLTDYLSKVRLLVESGQANEADAALFRGLPPEAAQVYRSLDKIADPSAPEPDPGPGPQ
jgi:HD-like signal output (HDOD) protein